MKHFKKILAVVVCLAVVFSCFAGCKNFDSEVKKASKKLSAYSIVATLDDENKKIVASESVKYINREEVSLTALCFHLYGNAFSEKAVTKPYTNLNKIRCFPNGENFGYLNITSVTSKGSVLEHVISSDGSILEVVLPKEIFPGESVNVEVAFELKLSENTHRLGFFEDTINLGNWYPIICKYSEGDFDRDPYYSIGDPFFSDIANYDVQISYPSKYLLASTGNLASSSDIENIKTQRYQAKAVRDFAMVFGSNYEMKSAKVGNTDVSVFAYAGDDAIDYYLETATKSLTFFSNQFGLYPYRTLNIAITRFMFGGMEYPNLVMISDKTGGQAETAKVIVHEVAHQWWYGLVGNDEVEEAWLDEALTEYSTLVFFENHTEYKETRESMIADATESYLLYTDVIATTKLQLKNKINYATYEYSSEYEYVYMVYVKGMLMFESLRTTVGDENFFGSLKKYYENNKFKIATKRELVFAFEDYSRISLESFFDSWLEGRIIIGEESIND